MFSRKLSLKPNGNILSVNYKMALLLRFVYMKNNVNIITVLVNRLNKPL